MAFWKCHVRKSTGVIIKLMMLAGTLGQKWCHVLIGNICCSETRLNVSCGKSPVVIGEKQGSKSAGLFFAVGK